MHGGLEQVRLRRWTSMHPERKSWGVASMESVLEQWDWRRWMSLSERNPVRFWIFLTTIGFVGIETNGANDEWLLQLFRCVAKAA